ncbi:MAG: TGS domain-containing protein [Deltaproteobacteria bacterium]|nr:TGS domain-containing protein [Deltaproteobacteria bacterium]MBW1929825.1 TGS domain-containing protein [Deltaproteobacteria bacterium]MBW2024130.1 TGS domain-containing protein [Deltaproteobacteria bacterium]MBW2126059.1 TGS domain-containing protein [Deltaproteobacteria bacterium]RLB24404.1 MAG: MoaD/ThiS family protein [Deltaproteobacteria bacterium]
MEVSVKLISIFTKYGKNLDNGTVILKEGDTVATLAQRLGLPMKYVRLVFVNGKQVGLDYTLSQGDSVFFLPPALGGG